MPSRPLRPGLPTFYLDHSALCDAFLGGILNDRAHSLHRPLFAWTSRVAREANLCFSQAHLQELAQWGDREKAEAMAAWLDGLDLVWVDESTRARPLEAEYWVRVAVGHPPATPFRPFLPSMFSAVVTGPDAVAAAVEAATLPGMLSLFREIDAREHRHETRKWISLGHNDRRAAAALGVSKQRIANEMAYRDRVRLRKLALRAHQRIVERGESLPSETKDGVHVSEALVALVESNPAAMPSWRITNTYSLAWMDLVGSRQRDSKKSRALESSFGDYRHLAVGAAYCDVFTCDADVDRCLGDSRVRLGLDRQISTHKSSATDFVARLLATWP